MTAEQLTRQYFNGKSIRQLSQETGKGEWAIRKQIQRYQNSQKTLRETHPVGQEQMPTAPKQKAVNKFAALLAAIGFIVALYFIYTEIKNKRNQTRSGI